MLAIGMWIGGQSGAGVAPVPFLSGLAYSDATRSIDVMTSQAGQMHFWVGEGPPAGANAAEIGASIIAGTGADYAVDFEVDAGLVNETLDLSGLSSGTTYDIYAVLVNENSQISNILSEEIEISLSFDLEIINFLVRPTAFENTATSYSMDIDLTGKLAGEQIVIFSLTDGGDTVTVNGSSTDQIFDNAVGGGGNLKVFTYDLTPPDLGVVSVAVTCNSGVRQGLYVCYVSDAQAINVEGAIVVGATTLTDSVTAPALPNAVIVFSGNNRSEDKSLIDLGAITVLADYDGGAETSWAIGFARDVTPGTYSATSTSTIAMRHRMALVSLGEL